MALERLQALALFWVPQNDLVVSPAARQKLAVKTPCDCMDTEGGAAIHTHTHTHRQTSKERRMVVQAAQPNTHTAIEHRDRCPVRVWRHLPSDMFHTLIVLSPDPLTTCDGSVGLNWTQVTVE